MRVDEAENSAAAWNATEIIGSRHPYHNRICRRPTRNKADGHDIRSCGYRPMKCLSILANRDSKPRFRRKSIVPYGQADAGLPRTTDIAAPTMHIATHSPKVSLITVMNES